MGMVFAQTWLRQMMLHKTTLTTVDSYSYQGVCCIYVYGDLQL